MRRIACSGFPVTASPSQPPHPGELPWPLGAAALSQAICRSTPVAPVLAASPSTRYPPLPAAPPPAYWVPQSAAAPSGSGASSTHCPCTHTPRRPSTPPPVHWVPQHGQEAVVRRAQRPRVEGTRGGVPRGAVVVHHVPQDHVAAAQQLGVHLVRLCGAQVERARVRGRGTPSLGRSAATGAARVVDGRNWQTAAVHTSCPGDQLRSCEAHVPEEHEAPELWALWHVPECGGGPALLHIPGAVCSGQAGLRA